MREYNEERRRRVGESHKLKGESPGKGSEAQAPEAGKRREEGEGGKESRVQSRFWGEVTNSSDMPVWGAITTRPPDLHHCLLRPSWDGGATRVHGRKLIELNRGRPVEFEF